MAFVRVRLTGTRIEQPQAFIALQVVNLQSFAEHFERADSFDFSFQFLFDALAHIATTAPLVEQIALRGFEKRPQTPRVNGNVLLEIVGQAPVEFVAGSLTVGKFGCHGYALTAAFLDSRTDKGAFYQLFKPGFAGISMCHITFFLPVTTSLIIICFRS